MAAGLAALGKAFFSKKHTDRDPSDEPADTSRSTVPTDRAAEVPPATTTPPTGHGAVSATRPAPGQDTGSAAGTPVGQPARGARAESESAAAPGAVPPPDAGPPPGRASVPGQVYASPTAFGPGGGSGTGDPADIRTRREPTPVRPETAHAGTPTADPPTPSTPTSTDSPGAAGAPDTTAPPPSSSVAGPAAAGPTIASTATDPTAPASTTTDPTAPASTTTGSAATGSTAAGSAATRPAGAQRGRPWADLDGGFEPDERADNVITAYPSARPGPAGAIHGVGITVLVTDLQRSVQFYREMLGFYEIDAGSGSAVLASGDTRLVLRTVRDLSGVAGRQIYLNLEVGDVEAVYEELKRKGAEFVHGPRPVNRGDRLELWAAAFHDPDKHNIAVTQWRAIR